MINGKMKIDKSFSRVSKFRYSKKKVQEKFCEFKFISLDKEKENSKTITTKKFDMSGQLNKPDTFSIDLGKSFTLYLKLIIKEVDKVADAELIATNEAMNDDSEEEKDMVIRSESNPYGNDNPFEK